MKKLILTLGVAVALAPMTSMAANSGPGCGLGKMVWDGQEGMVANVLASTTNGTFGSQTFGMTSGTSECDGDAVVSNEHQKKIFVASNADSLAMEAAQGGGMHLTSLAELMGIQEQDRDAFFKMTQKNYDDIFANAGDHTLVIASLDSAMSANPNLAKYVN